MRSLGSIVQGRLGYFRQMVPHIGIASAALLQLAEDWNRLARRLSLRWRVRQLHVCLEGYGAPVAIRLGSSDIEVFRQVFVFQQYMPVTKLESPTVIVDCGANAGYSALFFLKHFPEARVIAVEPDPDNAELCRHNLHPFLDRVVVIQKALWGRVTKLSFVEESRRPGEEWGIQVQSTPTSSAEDAVEAIDIPSLMEATDLTFIDILKIDIEKSEADVFQANPTAWLHLVRNIAIELHGPTCTEAFRAALKGYSFSEEVCGEITLCLGMKPSLLT